MYQYIYLISISGDPKSEVYGYFTNEGIFSGMVYTETDTIHIEPSHRFGVNTSHNVSNEYRAMQMAIVLFWGGGGGGGVQQQKKIMNFVFFVLFCLFYSFSKHVQNRRFCVLKKRTKNHDFCLL